MVRFVFGAAALAALVLCLASGAAAADQGPVDALRSSGSLRQLAAYDIPDEDDDTLLRPDAPPPAPTVFATLEDGYGAVPPAGVSAHQTADPQSDLDEEGDEGDEGDEGEWAFVPAPVPQAEWEAPEAEGAWAPAPAPEAEALPTDFVSSSPVPGLEGIELSVSSQDDYYRILRFSGEARQIDAVFVNDEQAVLDESQVPPGWVLHNSQGLDLSTPIALDLYDEEENKVFVPLSSLTSQNLDANFGGDVVGAPQDGRGYYTVAE